MADQAFPFRLSPDYRATAILATRFALECRNLSPQPIQYLGFCIPHLIFTLLHCTPSHHQRPFMITLGLTLHFHPHRPQPCGAFLQAIAFRCPIASSYFFKPLHFSAPLPHQRSTPHLSTTTPLTLPQFSTPRQLISNPSSPRQQLVSNGISPRQRPKS